MRLVSVAIEQFLTEVKCHGRPKRSAYHLPRRREGVLVLCERVVALASFAVMSVARALTPEQSATFKEACVVAYEVTVDRNKLPIDGALRQVEFMLPRNEHGEWVGRVPVGVAERLAADALRQHAEQLEPGKDDGGDDTEWWPASAFPADLHTRLRRASSPDRRSRHVRFRFEDRVKLYAVADAKRNWLEAWAD